MRGSRPVSWIPVSLFIIAFLLTLAVTGCKQGKQGLVVTPGHKILDCQTTITVETDHVDPVFVCNDLGFQTVTWTPGNNVTSFIVQFGNDCPFLQCTGISYAAPSTTKVQSQVAPQPQTIKLYKYSISINGKPSIDPHVVGGGHP
jgi:hypothetical protein